VTDRHITTAYTAPAWHRAVKTTDLFDGAVDGVVVSRVRIERSELHPAHAQLGRSVADEAADISADLTSQQRAILTSLNQPPENSNSLTHQPPELQTCTLMARRHCTNRIREL